ncbi:prephenate dehydratase [Vibrio sp. S4M6]|uniref:prephenate dehydratase domain-containing protein n=1 Tax=Vibrio sinus TaxID=2946865 RepID=UPI00202A8BCA|nr:prephenate dehydratase domain-containing protein [Vibrio sinus]MCL9780021.1 prephenate dehydratase [Vibrio sinus]
MLTVKRLFTSILLATPLVAQAAPTIYAQASKGSFNDAALHQLLQKKPELKANIIFSGTPLNTYMQAEKHDGVAFTAIANSTIKGKLVSATVKAIEQYKVTKPIAFITTPIDMCAFMNKQDVKEKLPVKAIASHPAALAEVSEWNKNLKATEIAVPQGTAYAAKEVSLHKLPQGTAAVGSCVLNEIYPNLVKIGTNIQDNKSNRTSFMLTELSKRAQPISESQAKVELQQIIKTEKNNNKDII